MLARVFIVLEIPLLLIMALDWGDSLVHHTPISTLFWVLPLALFFFYAALEFIFGGLRSS